MLTPTGWLQRLLLALLTSALLVVSSSCGDPSPSQPERTATIAGTARSGPTCPVATDPPDPACADRPVAGAVVVVRAPNGDEVERVSTETDGDFTVEVPPGTYRLEPQPVEGLLGTAPAVDVVVGPEGSSGIVLAYDTGIR